MKQQVHEACLSIHDVLISFIIDFKTLKIDYVPKAKAN